MSPTFHRGRFFTMAPSNKGISSRFNSVPIIMEKVDLLERDRSDFNRLAVLPDIGSHARRQSGIDALYELLPHDFNDLPPRALDLSAQEEALLASEVAREMHLESAQALKDAYVQMANTDANLDGLTEFHNVQRALSRHKVVLPPPLLRLVAARCLSVRKPWKVNYERLISFLGSARREASPPGPHGPETLANGDAHRHASPQASVRSHDGGLDNRSHRSTDLLTDRPGISSILRALKNHPNFKHLNLDSLRSNFQRADALHRGALSEQQIKDICAYCNLPLDDSLAMRLIRSCPYKGGGQYDWQEFLRILERVRPQPTGLFIPRSRRPLEMARLPMEASSEWPHGSHAFTSRSHALPSQGSRASSQAGQPQQPLFRERSASPRGRQDLYTQREYLQPENDLFQQQQQFQQQALYEQQLQQQQAQYEQQLQQQQAQYEQQLQQQYKQQQQAPTGLGLDLSQLQAEAAPGGIGEAQTQPAGGFYGENPSAQEPLPPAELSGESVSKEPWLNRFVKLADALYLADRSKTGYLDISKAQRLVTDYNQALMLDFKPPEIEQALAKCTKEATGRVDINAMLRILGTMRF